MNTPSERKVFTKSKDITSAISHLKDICGDDTLLLADMIEGEIDLEGYVDTVSNLITNDESTCNLLKLRADQITSRKKRISDRAKRLRTLLATVLDDAGSKTVSTPESTVTITRLKPGLVIEDDAEIPVDWWKRSDPKLNIAGIRKQLNDRREALEAIPEDAEDKVLLRSEIDKEFPNVPGVSLDNGELSLTIRRS
ncbi:MAG: hypothetical protein GY928_17265 [Colwellia sp.]|nr:hypothetical protein [Colwellia sp.]